MSASLTQVPPPDKPETRATNFFAVLFADVAGSTKLYDTLGDSQAKVMIDECIALMRGVTAQYGGRVIKTIGDEVMCVLPDADSGCLAATDMQLKISQMSPVSGVQRAIRVGFHCGEVIEEGNDVFGDTVNVAARMAGLAKQNQIMTTRVTVDKMSSMLRGSTRPIAALSVKGKGDDVMVCEVIWQPSDEMTMTTPTHSVVSRSVELELVHDGQQYRMTQSSAALVLGRDAACGVVTSDRMASRQHAIIERRRDKFFLIDQSTNGTFVAFSGEAEMTLRREEAMLRGSGRIALGHSVSESSETAITFKIHS